MESKPKTKAECVRRIASYTDSISNYEMRIADLKSSIERAKSYKSSNSNAYKANVAMATSSIATYKARIASAKAEISKLKAEMRAAKE